ncbi:MAG: DcaP family trimeric outer membrane transporter [Pseudomonadota bacterium]
MKSNLSMAVCAIATTLAPQSVFAASDAEVAELRRQLAILTERLNELEQKQVEVEQDLEKTEAAAAANAGPTEGPGAAVRAGAKPGSFIFPGTDTEITLGGYLKADFIYDLDEDVGDFFIPETLTTGAGQNDANAFSFAARESRLNLRTRTPTEYGDFKTLFEADFVGSPTFGETFSNSFNFRLRHAVADFGPVKVGQFWSLFTPLIAYPNTVDFQGPAGIPFQRQAQVRYTYKDDNLTLAASIENPETTATLFSDTGPFGSINSSTPVGGVGTISFDAAPDFIAAATYKTKAGPVKLAGLARSLSVDTTDDNAFGYGLHAAARLSFWDGGTFQLQGGYGKGIGRYLINGSGLGAFQSADGDLDAIEAYGFSAFYSHKLTDSLTAQIGYGRYEVLDDIPIPASLDNVQTVHATLYYSPFKNVVLGAEAIWGERNNQGPGSDDALRLQTSVQYNF